MTHRIGLGIDLHRLAEGRRCVLGGVEMELLARQTRKGAAVAIAPTGITSGSTTMSCAGMPKSAARSTIFLATAKRTSGSSEIPVSSFEIATTGTLYFLTNGRTASRLSSSPVTELTMGLPSTTSRPRASAAMTDESIQIGTSVID